LHNFYIVPLLALKGVGKRRHGVWGSEIRFDGGLGTGYTSGLGIDKVPDVIVES